MSKMKVLRLVVFSNHSAFHRWTVESAALQMLSSDELMSCCAAGTNGCLNLRCSAFLLSGQMSAKWSRCPGSVAGHAGDSVVRLRRSTAGWIAARRKFPAGVQRRHPVTVRKTPVMTGSMKQVWALRHQTGAQYYAVECSRVEVAIRNVIAPAPQPEPVSHLKSATRDVSFLRRDSRCRRYVSNLSNVPPRHLST